MPQWQNWAPYPHSSWLRLQQQEHKSKGQRRVVLFDHAATTKAGTNRSRHTNTWRLIGDTRACAIHASSSTQPTAFMCIRANVVRLVWKVDVIDSNNNGCLLQWHTQNQLTEQILSLHNSGEDANCTYNTETHNSKHAHAITNSWISAWVQGRCPEAVENKHVCWQEAKQTYQIPVQPSQTCLYNY